MTELPGWDWAYGQTPEFTQTVQRSFMWGEVTARIHSKHGVILSCALSVSDGVNPELKGQLDVLAARLREQKYGFVDEDVLSIAGVDGDRQVDGVWKWLRAEMNS